MGGARGAFHLDRNDSRTIGFVAACLFREAIDVSELRSWADHVLLATETYPTYVVELSLFEGYPKDIFKVIGFVPSCGLSSGEGAALVGIAYLRGREPVDCALSRAEALAALEQHPGIVDEFRATFPFVDLGGEIAP